MSSTRACPCPDAKADWHPPRLVAKDRHDEARAIITKYHANGDGSHPIVHLEMREMTDSLRAHPMTNWRQYFNLRDLFRTRSRRYRMMLNIAFSWFGQFSGNKYAAAPSHTPAWPAPPKVIIR